MTDAAEGIVKKICETARARGAAFADARAVRSDSSSILVQDGRADKAYAAVGLGPEVDARRVEIAKGGYARHVEQYLLDGQFADADEQIDSWGFNIPADKLEGYWSLLVVKKCLAEKDYAAAAREAGVLVNVNPRSNYAAELLMMAAEAQDKLGRPDAAAATRKRIVKQYPESPLAAKAVEKAKKGN